MPRPPGHGPKYEVRKQEIIDRAASLFAEQGFSATSIDDIGSALKLGRGALYYYIGSKERLLVEIQSRVLRPAQVMAREINSLVLDPVLRLRVLSEALLTIMFQRLPHIWAVEHDYRSLTGENLIRFRREQSEFENTVRKMIREAIDSGAFREMDSQLAMLQFLNMHNHTYRWINPDANWTPRYLSQQYCMTLFGGFSKDGFDSARLEDCVNDFIKNQAPAALLQILDK